MLPKPIIRVGLGTNLKDIRIKASAGMKVYEATFDYRFIAEDAAETQVKGGGEKLIEKFAVLLAHAKESDEAGQPSTSARVRRQGHGRRHRGRGRRRL
ncbi:MAG: hypothetical protein M0C28_00870 [Candidatus Moduliflexus flocculans]|nr:hypothetical protein [Candidatus Moduliflexus flocculans]